MGVPEEDSKTAARCLVRASLRGFDGQGVRRLLEHIPLILSGSFNPRPKIRIVKERGAAAVLDGDHGLGSVVATKAMLYAMGKTTETGVALVNARNTNDLNMAANYAMLALESDCIGIVMTNARPWVAPYGGRTRMLGTNPICIAIPTEEEIPIVLDAATSTVSHSRIDLAHQKGEQIPLHWAMDILGRPTTDPGEALAGALTPLGYKGFGLALIVDLLTGALAGMACGRSILENSLQHKSTIGQLFIAINIAALTDPRDFKRRADSLIRDIKSSPLAPGFQRILMPGELEQETQQQREHLGIPISDKDWRGVEKLAAEIGLDISQMHLLPG